MRVLLIGILLLLASCASQPAKVVVRTERVEVPVLQRVTPPKELLECGKVKPLFRFEDPQDGSDNALLTPQGQEGLKQWVDKKDRCLKGWRAWSK